MKVPQGLEREVSNLQIQVASRTPLSVELCKALIWCMFWPEIHADESY